MFCSLPDANNNSAAGGAGPSASAAHALTQSVVVENPPSLDKDGNKVRVVSLYLQDPLLHPAGFCSLENWHCTAVAMGESP